MQMARTRRDAVLKIVVKTTRLSAESKNLNVAIKLPAYIIHGGCLSVTFYNLLLICQLKLYHDKLFLGCVIMIKTVRMVLMKTGSTVSTSAVDLINLCAKIWSVFLAIFIVRGMLSVQT